MSLTKFDCDQWSAYSLIAGTVEMPARKTYLHPIPVRQKIGVISGSTCTERRTNQHTRIQQLCDSHGTFTV
jgi:hypothetical protein